MSKIIMLITLLLAAALIPINLSVSAAESDSEANSPESTSTSETAPTASNATSKPDTVQLVFQILDSTTDLLDLLFVFLERILQPLTFPISFLLKGLLTPVIFLVRILLLIVKFLLDVLLYGLLIFVLEPLLSALGMDDLIQSLKYLIDIVDLLLDNVSCLLGLLSYFSWLLPGCGSSGGFSRRDTDHAQELLSTFDTDLVPQ